jgi:hypothetical protein
MKKIEMDPFYFIYHGGGVKLRDVRPETWAEVLDCFINRLKPYLKYIDGIKTMEQIIVDGDWLHSPGKNFKIKEASFYPENSLGFNTRGFFIANLAEGALVSFAFETPIKNYPNLILTEKGTWVQWNMRILENTCASSMVQMIDTADFANLLEGYKNNLCGLDILDALYILLHGCVEAKEQRLEEFKHLRDQAERIKNRVVSNI